MTTPNQSPFRLMQCGAGHQQECNAAVIVVNPFNPASLKAAKDVIQEASAKQKKVIGPTLSLPAACA